MVTLRLDNSDSLHLEHRCTGSRYPFVFADTHIVELPNDGDYIIPKGTKFDFASIPTVVLWLFSKESQARRAVAYAVHDSMYIEDYKESFLGRKDARKYADKVFLDLMNILAPDKKLANYTQWFFVRLFGGAVY